MALRILQPDAGQVALRFGVPGANLRSAGGGRLGAGDRLSDQMHMGRRQAKPWWFGAWWFGLEELDLKPWL